MSPDPRNLAALPCEITARAVDRSELARIVEVCARDLGQSVKIVRAAQAEHPVKENVLTLRVPAALAATQHPVWCLACRLACFCPNARVSVLVEAEQAFVTGAVRTRTTPRKSRRAA